jgi:hypothetical protein
MAVFFCGLRRRNSKEELQIRLLHAFRIPAVLPTRRQRARIG